MAHSDFRSWNHAAGGWRRNSGGQLRFAARGIVRLELPSGGVRLKGELIDVSANGFRVALPHPAPETGEELEFSHQYFHGRARVMWLLRTEDRFEAGCMVLRG